MTKQYPAGLGQFDIPWKSGDERLPIGPTTWTDATPSTVAAVVAWPFYSGREIQLAHVNIGLTTAQTGGEAMCGIYADDGTGRPGALIADLGTLDLSATTGKRSWTATARVRGLFWVLIHLKNVATQVTVRSPNGMVPFFLPIASNILVSGSAGPRGLWLQTAYPASMPATAPAVAPHTQANIVLATVDVA